MTALDVSDARLGRLRENLARTGLSARVVAADALGWTPAGKFDAILLDAPCSASGTIRRHPDLPHLRGGGDPATLVALQATLLARAWRVAGAGRAAGLRVCSLLPSEGEEQVARFLARDAGGAGGAARRGGARASSPAGSTPPGGLRLRPDYWPERGGMDGFYAAGLERRALPRDSVSRARISCAAPMSFPVPTR